jgi:hypothetical protein
LLGKQVTSETVYELMLGNGSVKTDIKIGVFFLNCVFLFDPCKVVIKKSLVENRQIACGGGVEYLHLSSAGRRRRRKGKSRI